MFNTNPITTLWPPDFITWIFIVYFNEGNILNIEYPNNPQLLLLAILIKVEGWIYCVAEDVSYLAGFFFIVHKYKNEIFFLTDYGIGYYWGGSYFI